MKKEITIMEIVRMSLGINREEQLRQTGRRWRWHRIMESKRDKLIKQIDKEEMENTNIE